MVLQVAVVLGEIIDAEVAKALPETSLDDVSRVVRKVDAAELVDEIPKEAEFLEVEGWPYVVQQGHVSLRAGRSR